jgi:hypothetical protein
VLIPWNQRASMPRPDETRRSYDLRHLNRVMRLLPVDHRMRISNLNANNDDAIAALKPQIIDAVKQALTDPRTVPQGEMREVKRTGPSGASVSEFIGQDSFVKQAGAPFIHLAKLINPVALAMAVSGKMRL